jgi:hypothetical protein
MLFSSFLLMAWMRDVSGFFVFLSVCACSSSIPLLAIRSWVRQINGLPLCDIGPDFMVCDIVLDQ